MSKKKVFIAVGHGGNDPGAVKYLVEKDINLKMALACRTVLEAAGVQVLLSRTKDENDSVEQEVKECNSFDPDLTVAIHNNSGGGKGFEVFHSISNSGKSLAEYIEKEVLAIGQISRGVKTRKNSKGKDYYYYIRETTCPAVICEGVFVDNKSDAAKADTDAECNVFGVAYARGILKTLGEDIPTSIPNQSKKLYRVQVGAFTNKDGAERLKTQLRAAGFIDAYIKE